MQAFHGDKKIKAKYLARVRAHIKADNLIRGKGWENGKGCAVGCTLEAYNHAQYPVELGIPEWLARLEDALFEGMSEEKSRDWPEKILKACWTGADLEKAKAPIVRMILEHAIQSMKASQSDKSKFPHSRIIKRVEVMVRRVITCTADNVNEAARLRAQTAAWMAARLAESTAWEESAACSAHSAASAAEAAAWSTAWAASKSMALAAESAAWSAARSVVLAAESAAWSAASAVESVAQSGTRSAARLAAFDCYADQVLKIIRGIKP